MTTARFYDHTPAPYSDSCRADCAGCAEKARDAAAAELIGKRVRAFDFEGREDCYVEGYVLGLREVEGCNRYEIQVSVDVWEGAQLDAAEKGCRIGAKVYPPVNGTPRLFGGECDGVRAI